MIDRPLRTGMPFGTRHRRRSLRVRGLRLLRGIGMRLSSSLTRRIVVLNLGGLFVLLLLFLYVNQFRQGLIDARVQSLTAQGEIIAAAIAASATVETDSLTIDPEKLLQQTPGQPAPGVDDDTSALESRSIRTGSVRCCAGSCRPPGRGRASMIATASC